MSIVVSIDGELVAPEAARVSVFDRGFLYGDSVFETIRTYDGEPFMLGAHLDRLEKSAESVFIDLPVPSAQIGDEIRVSLRAAENAESRIRVTVTRGSGPLGLDSDFEVRPLRVIMVSPLVAPSAEAHANGIAVVTYRTQRVAEATDAMAAKVGNYLVAVLAMRVARERGAEEALVVDGHGHIVEGATSNVFAVSKGCLITPSEEAGILPGITRQLVLDVAREKGVPFELRPISVSDAFSAEELMISSSTRELLPVTEIDGRTVGSGRPGPVARTLYAGFREKVSEIMSLAGD